MESWEISIPADMDLDIGNGRHPPSPAGLSNLNPDLIQDRKERKTFLTHLMLRRIAQNGIPVSVKLDHYRIPAVCISDW